MTYGPSSGSREACLRDRGTPAQRSGRLGAGEVCVDGGNHYGPSPRSTSASRTSSPQLTWQAAIDPTLSPASGSVMSSHANMPVHAHRHDRTCVIAASPDVVQVPVCGT